MALLIAFGSVAASQEFGTLTAAVHDLLAAAGLAGSDQSTDALCRAVIAAPAPQQDANPPVMSGKTVAQAEHGHLSSTDARWTEHVAAVLHAAGSSADHDEALQKLEAHTHPVQTIPPLVDDDGSRVTTAAEWPARREEILEVFRSQVKLPNGILDPRIADEFNLLAPRSTAGPLSRRSPRSTRSSHARTVCSEGLARGWKGGSGWRIRTGMQGRR